jgi:hypothetical protein
MRCLVTIRSVAGTTRRARLAAQAMVRLVQMPVAPMVAMVMAIIIRRTIHPPILHTLAQLPPVATSKSSPDNRILRPSRQALFCIAHCSAAACRAIQSLTRAWARPTRGSPATLVLVEAATDRARRRPARHLLLDLRHRLTPDVARLLSIVPLVLGLHRPRLPSVERGPPIVTGYCSSPTFCPCFISDYSWCAAVETDVLRSTEITCLCVCNALSPFYLLALMCRRFVAT